MYKMVTRVDNTVLYNSNLQRELEIKCAHQTNTSKTNQN